MENLRSAIANPSFVQQGEFVEDFAAEAQTIFEDYGEQDGFQGIVEAKDEQVCVRIKEELKKCSVKYVVAIQENVFSAVDWEESDVTDIAKEWLRDLVHSKRLPSVISPSGSYPDDLFHLYIMLATVYHIEWVDSSAKDNDNSEEPENPHNTRGSKKRKATPKSSSSKGKKTRALPQGVEDPKGLLPPPPSS